MLFKILSWFGLALNLLAFFMNTRNLLTIDIPLVQGISAVGAIVALVGILLAYRAIEMSYGSKT